MKTVVVDGVEYRSQRAAAKAYGKDAKQYYNRADKDGMSFEDWCLAETSTLLFEFRGQEYASKKEACDHFHVLYKTVSTNERRYGGTFADALERVVKNRDGLQFHAFGQWWDNLSQLASAKNVSRDALKGRIKSQPDVAIKDHIRALQKNSVFNNQKPRTVRTFPDPILFGWLFKSWAAAFDYWQPVGVNQKQFYDAAAKGGADQVCYHCLQFNAERGNLTPDLQRKDKTGPMEQVFVFDRFGVNDMLAKFGIGAGE